jgi:hypothetical protein
MLTWLLWFPLFIFVRSDVPPFSVIYPSATPTVNYMDDVSFEWASWFDDTEVGVFCGQGDTFLILQSSTGKNPGVSRGRDI